MKKKIIAIGMVALMSLITACGNETASENKSNVTQQDSGNVVENNTEDIMNNGSSLVAYFTYSENIGDTSDMSVDAISSASLNRDTKNTEGNLQVMAQEIVSKQGADLHHIIIEEPYDADYSTMLDRVVDEYSEDTKVALQSKIDNLDQYDVVYIGTPVWNGALPPAMETFFEENDLDGKTIIPFGIHLGSRFGSIIDQIEKYCPNATILQGFTINAQTSNDEVRKEFDAWLDDLNLN